MGNSNKINYKYKNIIYFLKKALYWLLRPQREFHSFSWISVICGYYIKQRFFFIHEVRIIGSISFSTSQILEKLFFVCKGVFYFGIRIWNISFLYVKVCVDLLILGQVWLYRENTSKKKKSERSMNLWQVNRYSGFTKSSKVHHQLFLNSRQIFLVSDGIIVGKLQDS